MAGVVSEWLAWCAFGGPAHIENTGYGIKDWVCESLDGPRHDSPPVEASNSAKSRAAKREEELLQKISQSSVDEVQALSAAVSSASFSAGIQKSIADLTTSLMTAVAPPASREQSWVDILAKKVSILEASQKAGCAKSGAALIELVQKNIPKLLSED